MSLPSPQAAKERKYQLTSKLQWLLSLVPEDRGQAVSSWLTAQLGFLQYFLFHFIDFTTSLPQVTSLYTHERSKIKSWFSRKKVSDTRKGRRCYKLGVKEMVLHSETEEPWIGQGRHQVGLGDFAKRKAFVYSGNQKSHDGQMRWEAPEFQNPGGTW